MDYNIVYAEVSVALSELTLTGTIVKDQVQARDRYFNNYPVWVKVNDIAKALSES